MNIHLAILLTLISIGVCAQNSITGVVTDETTQEPIIIGPVALYSDGVLIAGTETDFDGKYSFSKLSPGKYDVEASYVGCQAKRMSSIVVVDTDIQVNISLGEVKDFFIDCCSSAGPPIIHKDAFTQGRTITLRNNGVIQSSSWYVW